LSDVKSTNVTYNKNDFLITTSSCSLKSVLEQRIGSYWDMGSTSGYI